MNPEDSFTFNADFSAPLQKIKISTVAARVESTDERKETKDRVEEERRHQTEVRADWLCCYGAGVHQFVQACIVRIMKNRKHMTHNDLVNEVTRQLSSRFQPNPLSIKKRIEGLIEVSALRSVRSHQGTHCMVARISGALRRPQVI